MKEESQSQISGSQEVNAKEKKAGVPRVKRKKKLSKRQELEILAEEAEDNVVRLFAQTVVDVLYPDKDYSFRDDVNFLFSPLIIPFGLKKMPPFKRIDTIFYLYKILEDVIDEMSQEEYEEVDCKLGDIATDLSFALSDIYDENDFEVRQKLFDECMAYLANYRGYYDDIEYIILDYDDERFFDRLKPFVENEINQNDTSVWKYVPCMLTILSKEGYSLEQLKEYASNFESTGFIDSWFVNY